MTSESRLKTSMIASTVNEGRIEDLALYAWLDMAARVEVARLQSFMKADAEKVRQETSRLVGNPLNRYSIIKDNGRRLAVIKAPVDTRDFGVKRISLSQIYDDSRQNVQKGSKLRDLLFNGAIKGPHAIKFAESLR